MPTQTTASQLRPYLPENTGSRPISEVKPERASLVLWFERTWESRGAVVFGFCVAFLHNFHGKFNFPSSVKVDGNELSLNHKRMLLQCSHLQISASNENVARELGAN